MKRIPLVLYLLLFVCAPLSAQTYHYTFTHDTVGNRVSRVYLGIRSDGADAPTAPGMAEWKAPGMTTEAGPDGAKLDYPPVISTGQSEWRDLENPRSTTIAHSDEAETTIAAKDSENSARWSSHYIGGRYERVYDTETGLMQFLYLGGDAYSAPMVLRKVGSGSWTPYVIGRDYLGSITHIATTGGYEMAECHYTPWGNGFNTEMSDFGLSRGWCGHEHLKEFGLVNMNARLYDPALGRFLSPDPYIQAPDNPANFNRYSYCLNNPLKYTDKDGESLLLAMGIGAAIFGIGNLAAHALRKDDLSNWMWAKYFFSGALAGAIVGAACYGAFLGATTMASTATTKIGSLFWEMTAFNTQWAYPITTGMNLISSGINGLANKNDQWLSNFAKTTLGNFYLDENKSFFGEVWEGISRHTWEAPQQLIGYAVSSLKNGWNERVDLFGGATFGTYFNGDAGPGCTIGSYININSAENILDYDAFHSIDDYLMGHSYMADEFYLHEYGHTIQSKKWGPLYMIPVALSLYSALTNTFSVHNHYWVETAANRYSLSYFNKHFVSFAFPTTLFTK